MKEADDVPESMVIRTIVVLIGLPSVLGMAGGAMVGHSINGLPGAIAAGLFFGFSAGFAGTFLYWLIGPIETPPWPIIFAALALFAVLIVLFVL